MTPLRAAALPLALLLAGCGPQVKVWNPTTWFSAPGDERLITLEEAAPDIRPLMSRVESVEVKRYQGGIIVTAIGLPPQQGYWQAALRPLRVTDGVMVLEFRAAPPGGATPAGSIDSREITVAYAMSDQTVRDKDVTKITVRAQENEISVRPQVPR